MMAKKIFLILLLLTCYTKTKAQTKFEHNYLGNDFLMYKGVYLKLIDKPVVGFIHAFYNDLKYCQSDFNGNVIYPDPENSFVTVKDSLAKRIFIVENIVDKWGNTWTENTKSAFLDKPIFVLKDTVNGQIIYYMYDKEFDLNFPFNTSVINYNEEFFCSQIEREADDFTGKLTFNSPLMNGNQISSLIIYKQLNKGKNLYYLSLTTHGSTVNVNGSGIIILFNDGSKWTKTIKIDVEAKNNGYEYSVFAPLSLADLAIFSTKKSKNLDYIYMTKK